MHSNVDLAQNHSDSTVTENDNDQQKNETDKEIVEVNEEVNVFVNRIPFREKGILF